MNISQLTLVVTSACNFDCSYCRQTNENVHLPQSTIKKTIEFFYSYLCDEAYINFYGGEPLLRFEAIEYTVSLLKKMNRVKRKALTFALSTNASLLTTEMLHFFNKNKFDILISFDGLAQNISRKVKSLNHTLSIIRTMQRDDFRNIQYSTNSVFSPQTVSSLSDSLIYIIEQGVKDIRFTITKETVWDNVSLDKLENEMGKLSDYLLSIYNDNGNIPILNFRTAVSPPVEKEKPSLFACAAGRNRMAISPDGYIWGCHVFYDYLKNRKKDIDFSTYCFGRLDEFRKNHASSHQEILDNIKVLRQDICFTDKRRCFQCEEVNNCRTCPVVAASATRFIGKVPTWVCKLESIRNAVEMKMYNEIILLNIKKKLYQEEIHG